MKTYTHDVLEELPEEPKAAHTPEPWSTKPSFKNKELTCIQARDEHGAYDIAVCDPDYQNEFPVDTGRANARRIVACVNALVGVPTEVLEANPVIRLPELSYKDVTAQRDALLAALVYLVNAHEHPMAVSPNNGRGVLDHVPPAIKKARSAIAAVESGKVPS